MSAPFGPIEPPESEVAAPVDPLDAAARIEASGRGDIAARALGFDDVFMQAVAEFQAQTRNPAPSRRRGRPGRAVARAFFLVFGVILCVETVVPGTTHVGLVVSGAACWFTAQILGSLLWWGEGTGHGARAWPLAFGCGVGLLVFAGVLSLVLACPQIVVWTAWGGSAAVVLWRWPTFVSVLVCAGAVLISALVIATVGATAGAVVAGTFICASLLGLVFVSLRAIRRAHISWIGPGSLDAAPTRLVAQTAVRVIAQIATVILLWRMWPESFLWVAVGAVAAGAASEIVLECVASVIRRVAGRTTRWQVTRLWALIAGSLGGLVIVLVGVLIVWVAARSVGMSVPAPLLALFALNTGVGIAIACELRIGFAERATIVALLGLILVSVVTPALAMPVVTHAGVQRMATVGAFLAVAWAARSLARPQAW